MFCILALIFIFATQDNPTLSEHIKHKPRSMLKYRYDDLSRHISLLGAILYLMVVPPVVDPPTEDKKKKVKDDWIDMCDFKNFHNKLTLSTQNKIYFS